MPLKRFAKINIYQARLLLTEWLCTAIYVRKKCSVQKFQIVQHIRTATHIAASENKSKTTHTSGSQVLILQLRSNSMTRKDNFSNNLCEVLIASNISLKKLSSPKFRSFLKKYCNI